MQVKLLSQCNIFDARGIMVKCATKAQRKSVAEQVGTDEKLVYSWVKQVNLWQLNGMTADMAYLLVQAGVRDVEDLAKIDINKIKPVINALVACQVDFIPVSDEVLAHLICEAGNYVSLNPSDDDSKIANALAELVNDILNSANYSGDYYGLQLYHDFTAKEIKEKYINGIKGRIGNNKLSITIEHSDPAPVHLFSEDADLTFSQIQQGI